MTKRPTPETDAVLARLVKNQAGNSCDAVVIHHARKLERERDEAREVLREVEDKMRFQLRGYPESEPWGDAGIIAATMRCVDALDIVTEQRDEAREALKAVLELANDIPDESLDFWKVEFHKVLEESKYDPLT